MITRRNAILTGLAALPLVSGLDAKTFNPDNPNNLPEIEYSEYGTITNLRYLLSHAKQFQSFKQLEDLVPYFSINIIKFNETDALAIFKDLWYLNAYSTLWHENSKNHDLISGEIGITAREYKGDTRRFHRIESCKLAKSKVMPFNSRSSMAQLH
jgi:hypothetical protein